MVYVFGTTVPHSRVFSINIDSPLQFRSEGLLMSNINKINIRFVHICKFFTIINSYKHQSIFFSICTFVEVQPTTLNL